MTLMNITFGDDDSSSDIEPPKMPPKQTSPNRIRRPLPTKNINRTFQIIFSKSDFENKTIVPIGEKQISNTNNCSNSISEKNNNSINRSKSYEISTIENSDYDSYEYDDESESSSSIILFKNPIRIAPVPLKWNRLQRFPSIANRTRSQQTYPQKQNPKIPEIKDTKCESEKIISNEKFDPEIDQRSEEIDNPFIDTLMINNSNANINPFLNENIFSNKSKISTNTTNKIMQNNDFLQNNSNILTPNDNIMPQNSESESKPSPKRYVPNEFVKYRLKRSHKISLHGKIAYYQLYKDEVPLLHTTIKHSKSNGICYISEYSQQDQENEKIVGAILYANNRTTFSLRKKSEIGEEIMTIIYKPGAHGAPRKLSIFFPNIQKNIPQYLYNKLAILDESFKWELDTKGKFCIKSIKNCIIVNKRNREFATVLKVEKETIEIEAKDVLSQLIVFAIGLSSFLCKL